MSPARPQSEFQVADDIEDSAPTAETAETASGLSATSAPSSLWGDTPDAASARTARSGRILPERPHRPGGSTSSTYFSQSEQFRSHTVKTASLEDRQREKQRERRSTNVRRALWGLLAIAVVAGAVWLVAFSSVFALKRENISIDRTDPLGIINAEQVDAVLAKHPGTPLVRLGTHDVEVALEGIPEVADASVSTSFPSGLNVTLVAETPVACVVEAESCTAVTADADELTVSDEVKSSLPQVTMSLDQQQSSQDLQGLLGVLETIDAETRALITAASITDVGRIDFVLSSGATVVWGDASKSEAKARILPVVLQNPAQVYDLSVPEAPISY